MNKEIIILVSLWLIAIFCLLTFIPKANRRLAQITFLFAQTFSWIYEYFQVRHELIEFPFREFKNATMMSFSLHFVIFPTFAVFFILLYPTKKNFKWITIYYLLYGSTLPSLVFILEKYTSLIHYKNWNFIFAYIVNLIALYIVKKFVFWFNKGIVY
ncbi:CBO0543 family protein [Fredinandcohnia quinoae]|uniref:Uncharacterized protein n=1 Tax=Fredinandcohnia quinoae TaxID=2918902 RepID=A0AAW5E8D9_9BACI|nr:CBO0543 family protein [Fredinandcohnia sp. SECRCQ15]MCH1627199.1 hypothetical protein [Fredinandcohnia sp. SECRCQ15]